MKLQSFAHETQDVRAMVQLLDERYRATGPFTVDLNGVAQMVFTQGHLDAMEALLDVIGLRFRVTGDGAKWHVFRDDDRREWMASPEGQAWQAERFAARSGAVVN